jgi:hypothetical protein
MVTLHIYLMDAQPKMFSLYSFVFRFFKGCTERTDRETTLSSNLYGDAKIGQMMGFTRICTDRTAGQNFFSPLYL